MCGDVCVCMHGVSMHVCESVRSTRACVEYACMCVEYVCTCVCVEYVHVYVEYVYVWYVCA